MTLVKYMIEYLKINNKTNKAEIVFKRVPTQQDIDMYIKKTQENKSDQHPSTTHFFGPKEMINFFHLHNHADDEIQLNQNRIVIHLSLKEAQDKKLLIGNIVHLNIPENLEDIMKLKEGDNIFD